MCSCAGRVRSGIALTAGRGWWLVQPDVAGVARHDMGGTHSHAVDPPVNGTIHRRHARVVGTPRCSGSHITERVNPVAVLERGRTGPIHRCARSQVEGGRASAYADEVRRARAAVTIVIAGHTFVALQHHQPAHDRHIIEPDPQHATRRFWTCETRGLPAWQSLGDRLIDDLQPGGRLEQGSRQVAHGLQTGHDANLHVLEDISLAEDMPNLQKRVFEDGIRR